LYTGENRPIEETQRRKFTNAKKSWTEILLLLPEIFRISKCFQRSKQEIHINFSLVEERLRISNPFAHVQKVLI
jgi:hypothetical protein